MYSTDPECCLIKSYLPWTILEPAVPQSLGQHPCLHQQPGSCCSSGSKPCSQLISFNSFSSQSVIIRLRSKGNPLSEGSKYSLLVDCLFFLGGGGGGGVLVT